MLSWRSSKAEVLKPLPLSQREKSYSSETGAVYQYLFKGLAGATHVFEVSADRSPRFEVRVELDEAGLAACAERMQSELKWNEQYALAKLCLLAAFDSAATPEQLKQPVHATAEQLLAHMTTLNMA